MKQTLVPNKIIEKLISIELTPRENRILWFLIKELNGDQIKEKLIKTSEFIEKTGLYRQNLDIAIKSLLKKQIITRSKEGNQGKYIYKFNTDFFN